MVWNYLSIPKRLWLHCLSLRMIRNFITRFIMDAIIYPWWNLSLSILLKGSVTGDKWAAVAEKNTAHPFFRDCTTNHYNDVIMTTIASQITSLTVVYSTVYSDADQRKHQSYASLADVWGIYRDRWIPRTKGQLRGKCFHLMTSSCTPRNRTDTDVV